MKRTLLAVAALAGVAVGQAHAGVVGIQLGGPGTGISGFVVLSYGPASDFKYPGQGFEITSVGGTFTDTNIGIVNALITSLVPISPTSPLDPLNVQAPKDFSQFPVAIGLPPLNAGFLTYDNLFWPGGAPVTAPDFDGAGGFLDIYGLMFKIGGTAPVGAVVDLFDNGVSASGEDLGVRGFGVAVATAGMSLDYVPGDVTATVPRAFNVGDDDPRLCRPRLCRLSQVAQGRRHRRLRLGGQERKGRLPGRLFCRSRSGTHLDHQMTSWSI